MKNGEETDSEKTQNLVKTLQNHITENYYHCTNEILSGLGEMYVADERFKNNIDKHGTGTAEFVSKAIEIYCKNN
jgi:metal-responsive CopG/Arc/MetJ family transcriptional regulator